MEIRIRHYDDDRNLVNDSGYFKCNLKFINNDNNEQESQHDEEE